MAETPKEPESVTIPRRHHDQGVDGAAESIRKQLFFKRDGVGKAVRETRVDRPRVDKAIEHRNFRRDDHLVLFPAQVRRRVLEQTGLLDETERALTFDDLGHFDVAYDGRIPPLFKKSGIDSSKLPDLALLMKRARILASSMGGETEMDDVYLQSLIQKFTIGLQMHVPHLFRPDGTSKSPLETVLIPRITKTYKDPAKEYRRRLGLAAQALKAYCNNPDREMKCTADLSFIDKMDIDPLMAPRILEMHRNNIVMLAHPLAFHAMDIGGDGESDDHSVAPEMANGHMKKLDPSKISPLDPLTITYMMYENLENLLPRSPRFVAQGERHRQVSNNQYFYIMADDDIADFLREVTIGYGGPFHKRSHDPALGVVSAVIPFSK